MMFYDRYQYQPCQLIQSGVDQEHTRKLETITGDQLVSHAGPEPNNRPYLTFTLG